MNRRNIGARSKLIVVVTVFASALMLATLIAYSSGSILAAGDPTQIQSGIYLKLDGIVGESKDANHLGWIDISSFSWQVSQASSRGPASGLPDVESICLTSIVSKATPMLMLASVNGKMINNAVLEVTSVKDGVVHTYLTITLSKVIVSSYQLNQGNGEQPMDSFCLIFASVKVDYMVYSNEGVPEHTVVNWKVANSKI